MRIAAPAIAIGRRCRRASPARRTPWPTSPAGAPSGSAHRCVRRANPSPCPHRARAISSTACCAAAVESTAVASSTGDGHPVDAQRRRVDARLELEVARGGQVLEHVLEIAGHGDLAHGIGELAALDPEARRAAAVVAGDSVDAHAHELGDIEALVDVADQLARGDRPRLEPYIVPRRARPRARVPRGKARSPATELTA